MRHEILQPSREVTDSRIAAAWPDLQRACMPLPQQSDVDAEPARPEAAASDVPVAVGRLIVAAYAGLLLVFFALFAR